MAREQGPTIITTTETELRRVVAQARLAFDPWGHPFDDYQAEQLTDEEAELELQKLREAREKQKT